MDYSRGAGCWLLCLVWSEAQEAKLIIGIKGAQDQGKTSLAVHHIAWLLAHNYYEAEEVASTVKLNIAGTRFLSIEGIRDYLAEMVKKQYRHKILLLDECDRIFPHRMWGSREQTEALLGLWQDVKLFNIIIWTAHLGGGVDILLRQCTQVTILPRFDKVTGDTRAFILDAVDMVCREAIFPKVSQSFKLYDRWATVA